MRFVSPQIKPIKQPVQLFAIEHHCVSRDIGWPLESLFLQTFVPQTKPVLLPVQDLDLLSPAVDENEQSFLKRVELQGLLND